MKIKVTPSQHLIDTIVFPKGFELDDIHISNETETTDNAESNDPQLSKMLHNIIEELIDQTNKKDKHHDDDL